MLRREARAEWSGKAEMNVELLHREHYVSVMDMKE